MQKLLLHICCAPCSTVPIKRLAEKYSVSGFFYNPNIYPSDEYFFRQNEFEKYLKELNIPAVSGKYNNESWEEAVKEYTKESEGGKRCAICYHLRLYETALKAKELGYDLFTTTLTISPHKNAEMINKIGLEIQEEFGVGFLAENFKKQDGFKESCEMSRGKNMYRQDYCGCRHSIRI